jgi:phosphatidylglycerophosphate synthase
MSMSSKQNIKVIIAQNSDPLLKVALNTLAEKWEKIFKDIEVNALFNTAKASDNRSVKDLIDRDSINIVVDGSYVADTQSVEKSVEAGIAKLSEGDVIYAGNQENGAMPFVIGHGKTLLNVGFDFFNPETDNSVQEMIDQTKRHEDITVVEIKMENGFWKRITSEKEASDAEWEMLKLLQYRPGGLVAKFLNRPFSIRMTRKILNTPFITPNFVTVADFFLGLFALWFIFKGGYMMTVFGAFLFHLNSIIDGVDGEIAKMRHQSSPIGGYLDSISDEILGAILYIALGWNVASSTGSWIFLVLGVITSICSFGYALIHWHCKWKHGLGFYYWWECYKPRKEVQRSTSAVSYLKKLFWRDSIILIVFLAALFRFIDVFLIITVIPAVVNFTLVMVHIFVKKARW